MARRAPAGLRLVHDPDVVMRLPFPACLYGAIGDKVKVFGIGSDVGIGVLVLAGERCNLRLRPTAVLVARDEDRPTGEIRREFEKIYLAAVGREGHM